MKVLKIIAISIFSLMGLSLLLLAALPSLLSTNYGKEQLLNRVNDSIPGHLKIETLHLSWFGPSDIEGVELFDQKGSSLAKLDTLKLSTSLGRLLFTKTAAPLITLNGLNASLIAETNGMTNVERALSFNAFQQPVGTSLEPLLLENFNLSSEISPQNEPLHANLTAAGTTRQGNLKGSINLSGELGKKRHIKLDAKNLPILLVDQSLQYNSKIPAGLLQQVLGDQMDIQLTINGNQIDQNIQTPELNAVFAGDIKDDILVLKEGFKGNLRITPATFAVLKRHFKQENLPDITQPATLSMTVNKLTLPLEAPEKGQGDISLQLKDVPGVMLNINGVLEGENLLFQGTIEKQDLAVENFNITLSAKEFFKFLEDESSLRGTFAADLIKVATSSMQIEKSDWSYDKKSQSASLNFNGHFNDLAEKLPLSGSLKYEKERINFSVNQNSGKGSVDLEGFVERAGAPDMSLTVKGKFNQYPSETLNKILGLTEKNRNKLYALFGYSVTGDLNAQMEKMNGPLAFNLKGDNIAVVMDGQVIKGELTLHKPLTATITVTKEVSDYFLDEILPLLNSAVSADEPLHLSISNEGFRLPLQDIRLETLTMPKAVLSLGKIFFSRHGKLAEVLSVLNISSADTFSVWFTPAYFSVQNGVLRLIRLDMLVSDAIPIATWGSIDFVQDKVNMEVGLTGRAITRAFGPLPLPKSYMLAIPLRGTTSNPRLDKTKVTAKLASIAAMATGPQGILVGALLQLASGSFTDKIPEPTTKPLPWETDAPETSTTDEKTPADSDKKTNEIKKGAEKIINKLLGK